MLRMEIALFLVMAFVAAIYYSAGRRHTPLHRTFAVLLGTVLVHLLFDAATLYTVNHLDAVPRFWNDTLHRLFIGTMVLVVYLFYQYIAILVSEASGQPRRLDGPPGLPGPGGAGGAAPPRPLRRDAPGQLLRRHPRQRLLCERGLLPSPLRSAPLEVLAPAGPPAAQRHRRGDAH